MELLIHSIFAGRIQTCLFMPSMQAVWHGVAQWLDVEEDMISDVVPNKDNFLPKNIFTRSELFNDESQ